MKYIQIGEDAVQHLKKLYFIERSFSTVTLFSTQTAQRCKRATKLCLSRYLKPKTRHILKGLADKGFISLDYQLPLQGYDYLDYWQSNAYKTYCEAVLSGKENGALCSTPKLYCGSLALTMLGAALMDEWEIA